MTKSFDVFLSYNSKDKTTVRKLAKRLERWGLTPWLDEKDLRPGHPFQDGLEEAIRTAKAAAVCIGGHGIGSWQRPEVRAFLNQMVERGQPVIPVLLAGAPDKPDIGIFLKENTWVDFRKGITDEKFHHLVWGITGEKPNLSKPSPTPAAALEVAINGNQTEVSQRRPRVIIDRFRHIQHEDENGAEYYVESFHLLNLGESPAVSVHIEIPEFLGRTVELRDRPPAILHPRGEADLEVRNFEKLLESVQERRPYERGWSVKIPLRVEYRDLDHNRWSTNHAIVYTQLNGIAVEIVHPDDPPEWTDLAALAKAASRR